MKVDFYAGNFNCLSELPAFNVCAKSLSCAFGCTIKRETGIEKKGGIFTKALLEKYPW